MTPELLAKSGTEHAEQRALFAWAAFARWHGFEKANDMSQYGKAQAYHVGVPNQISLDWMHAIPNAGARGNKAAAANLKAEGLKAGVADILLPVNRPIFKLTNAWGSNRIDEVGRSSGLYIEMKRANGVPSDVSDEQLDFGNFVMSQGYLWFPAFGWRQASALVSDYLNCANIVLSPNQLKVMQKCATRFTTPTQTP